MEERGLQYDYLFDWVKKDNNMMNDRYNENTPIDNRNKQTIRPITGNNLTNQNFIITESIAVNNQNNQMIVEEKLNNNRGIKKILKF
jgi:hypothetical protein